MRGRFVSVARTLPDLVCKLSGNWVVSQPASFKEQRSKQCNVPTTRYSTGIPHDGKHGAAYATRPRSTSAPALTALRTFPAIADPASPRARARALCESCLWSVGASSPLSEAQRCTRRGPMARPEPTRMMGRPPTAPTRRAYPAESQCLLHAETRPGGPLARPSAQAAEKGRREGAQRAWGVGARKMA